MTATLSATSSAPGPIGVDVSTPACAAVSPHPGGKENKFTITSTAPGSCEQTVTDGDGNSVVVPVEVVVLQRGTLTNGSFHTCGLTSAGQDYCWGWNGRG